jgi:cytidyltransferase-like protein
LKVAISGGFDPIHPGHIQYIEEALKLGELIIILTRDDQLIQKKGKCVIPYEARKQILEWGLKGRGKVVGNLDLDITCKSSLRFYRPNIFAKGGDTWDANNLPEKEVCQELGIEIVFGVGGYDKPYSSSKFNF